MTADQVLAETFADHEHLAPDPEATWAEITARLDPRHPVRRTLAVAVTVAAVTVVALGGTVLLRDRMLPGPAAPTASPTAQVRPAVAILAGWLPDGAVDCGPDDPLRRCYRAGTLGITLRLYPAGVLGSPPDRVEVTGTGSYQLRFVVAGGGVAEVRLTQEAASAAELTATGRRIAGTLYFDRISPADASFVLTYVPGTHTLRRSVVGSDLGNADWPSGTRYDYARRDAPRTASADLSVFEIGGTRETSTWRGLLGPFTPGRTVQGHRTWVLSGPAGTTLCVDSFLPGRSVVVQAGNLPLETLYRVADGLRQH